MSATKPIFMLKQWDAESGTRDESAVSWGDLNSTPSHAYP